MQKELLEEWKEIPGYSGYFVSNLGKVKSIKNGHEKMLLGSYNKDGYIQVNLSCGNEKKTTRIHRLVALLFVPNPFMYKEVNHIDGNKENNAASNLEWCSRSENVKHAFDMGLKANKKGSESHLAKALYQFDLSGNLIRKWGSLVECAQELEKENPKNGKAEEIRKRLTSTLHERHKSCCGYLFSFTDSVDVEAKQNAAKMPVLAYPLSGNKGAYSICGEPIRFRGINDTQGYVMPNGKVACASLVSKCCKGKRDSHIGYKWAYEENVKEGLDVSGTLAVKRPIEQIDPITGEVVKTWTCGVMGIAKELGFATYTGISMCLSGKLKNSNGFVWRYKE